MTLIAVNNYQIKQQQQQQKYHNSKTSEQLLEFETALQDLAHHHGSGSKLSVVCSALIEASSSGVTPEDMFIGALATLEGKLLSEEGADDDWATHLALLKILNLSIISITDGSLYDQHFSVLSRVLRAMNVSLKTVATATASATMKDHKNKNNQQNQKDGFASTVRHLITVSTASTRTACATLHHAKTTMLLEKPILKLLQDCILSYFDNPSPKIRKTAHQCAMELLSVDGNASHQLLATVKEHIGQYVHAVLTSPIDQSALITNESHQIIRLFHMLHFVRQASGLLLLGPMSSATLTPASSSLAGHIDQDLIHLFVALMNIVIDSPSTTVTSTIKTSNSIKSKVVHLISCIFHCLLAIMEYDPTTAEEHLSNTTHIVALRCTQKEISSHVLASLLQKAQFILSLLKVSDSTFLSNSSNEELSSAMNGCRLIFTQLIVTSMCVLIHANQNSTETEDYPQEDNEKFQVVAEKLYPVALQTVVHSSSASTNGGNGDDSIVYRCSLELQKMNQLCLSQLIPPSPNLLLPCADSMKSLLHFKNRNHWNHLLQSYSHFVVQLNVILISDKITEIQRQQYADVMSSMIDRLIETHLAKHSNDPGAIPDIENAVGSIMEGIGIEQFLLFCSPLDKSGTSNTTDNTNTTTSKGGARGIRPARLWIINLLKSRGAKYYSEQPTYHLAFFQSQILNLARKCDAAAAISSSSSVMNNHQQLQKQACVDLWSLLVFFCANPVDMQSTLPALVPTMLRAIQDVRYHPHLVHVICNAIKALASGASQRLDESENHNTSHTDTLENKTLLQGDLKVLSEMSVKLLPTLFKMVENVVATPVSKESADSLPDNSTDCRSLSSMEQQERMLCTSSLTEAIAELARVAPPDYLQSLFKKVMHRLVLSIQQQQQYSKDATKSSGVEAYLYLSQALVASQSLESHSSVDLLYRSIKPLIRTDEQCVKTQKSAYKVLAEICNRYPDFVNSTEKLLEISELLVGSIMTCHVSARQMRLKCLNSMVKEFDRNNSQHMELMVQMTGEVFLCLKDSNGKARGLAYELLLSMARVFNDMNAFFPVVLGALAAKTAHMRSAAVMALSRLVFEFARHDENVQALLPSLLQTVVLLFDEKARELIKSVVGFVRVAVAAMSREQLEPVLPELIAGLFKSGKGKDRFRAKIKIILKKLVRLFGYEKITPFVPQSDSRLLTHMRKLAERAARRKAELHSSNADENADEFEAMMESDEEDSDDGQTLMTGATGLTKMTAMSGKSLRTAVTAKSSAKSQRSSMESVGALSVGGKSQKTAKSKAKADESGPRVKNVEKSGEVLDLLDDNRMHKHVQFSERYAGSDDDDDEDDGMMEFDANGRLVVHDAVIMMNDKNEDPAAIDEEEDNDSENAQIKDGSKRRRVSKFENAKEAKAMLHAKKNEEQRRKNQKERTLGAAYKAKKAGGDVKKKGQQFEPYAYIPLERKNYTKKFRGKAVSQMATVVRNSGNKRKR